MASAVLLARSLARQERPNWTRFYVRRCVRTIWPYLVWSAVYVAVSHYLDRNLFAVSDLPVDIAWGKAYFHLYFFSVLIQMSLVFPLLLWIVRKRELGFAGWSLVAVASQILVFYANYAYSLLANQPAGFLPFPASSLLWYLPPILLGVWLGVNWIRWTEVWARYRFAFAACAIGGLAGYLTMEVVMHRGGQVDGRAYNLLYILYATGSALLILQASHAMAAWRRIGPALAAVGNRSLSLFVIHPLVLYFLGEPAADKMFQHLPMPHVWAWAITFGASWVAVEILYLARIGPILFGR
jgi:peptidoglycan/LPS O-acetylase OafA/YrhL